MLELFEDPRFVTGVCEFNAANFFEAHEVWEELWSDQVGPTKQACQGLVQIAAGYHKLDIGNATGARKLLERGLRTLTPLLPDRVWAETFARRVKSDLDLVEQGITSLPPDRPSLPTSGD